MGLLQVFSKEESRHALARAIFLHQLGELRSYIAETMVYRAAGLNLVVNAGEARGDSEYNYGGRAGYRSADYESSDKYGEPFGADEPAPGATA